jgi:LysR family transcriptional regulator, transcriptional activator for dmlA
MGLLRVEQGKPIAFWSRTLYSLELKKEPKNQIIFAYDLTIMPKTIQPADLVFFSILAQSPSMTVAGREMGVTTAAVSRHLSQMETRLGSTLLNRSTRRMSLTTEGELFLAYSRKILGELDELENQLMGTNQIPQGLIRVNATLGFGRSHIAPLISQFVSRYPKVDVQLQLSVNPPPSGDDVYDICFRFGNPPDTRSIARLIAPNQRVVVASPQYLQTHGEPHSPADLAMHNCIGIRQGDEAYGLWRFTLRSEKSKKDPQATHNIKIRGNLTTNDGGIAVNWALAGHGILLRAQWDVEKYLQTGELIQLLSRYDSPDADIYAVYAERHRRSTRVKALVDFVSAAFRKDLDRG